MKADFGIPIHLTISDDSLEAGNLFVLASNSCWYFLPEAIELYVIIWQALYTIRLLW